MAFVKKNDINNQKGPQKFTQSKKPLAIIGIGARLPGNLRGVDKLWKALSEGKDCITQVPKDRWNLEKFYDPDVEKAGKIKNNKGGFIDGFKEFDADFFSIYPKVAECLDVRQRHLLEVTYESLEDAGIKIEDINGCNVAVMMGIFLGDEAKKNTGEDVLGITPHSAMGAADTTVPARIAYQFNLTGPTLAVDTACSSSLVAIHLACNALWNNEAEMAIAGGVNIMTSHEHNIMLSKGGFLSTDGYCKSFDAAGNGYVRGEGVGVVIIKPLEKAIADGDNIYALIRNSVVNSDGRTNDGLTVPNEFAQIEMLKKAYGDAGIDPKDVDFIEAHGTGTALGDPKECFAFANVFSKGRAKENPLIIGSIKSNIGHTEAVAGVAGLIKLVLAIKNQQIPPNLHFKKPNPKIKFDEWKLKVPTKVTRWPSNPKKPAIGGVNSFGAGGTNAHVVVEGYNENSAEVKALKKSLAQNSSPKSYLVNSFFILSAKNKEALKDLCQKYLNFLSDNEVNLESLCYSTFHKRSSLPEKLVVTINLSDIKQAREQILKSLESYIEGSPHEELVSGTSPDANIIQNDNQLDPLTYNSSNLAHKAAKPKLAFFCSGQGPQWYAMGRQLMASCPVFNKVVKDIDKVFHKLSGYSLINEMKKDAKSSRISETRIAQPAIMAVQIGLIEMWKFVGVKPDGVVGHSIGEVAAAYAAGSLTLEQAVEVIYYRSREQDKASGKGKMLAAGLTYSKGANLLQKHKIKDEVSIAAINGPNSIVFSGDIAPLEEIAKDLTEKDIFNKFLQVNVPFHSYHMDIVKDGMLKDLDHLKPSKAKIDLFSTVTGKMADGTHLNANYWFKNVRKSVFFNQAVERMIENGYTHFIEIAPHPVLSSGVIDILSENKISGEVLSTLSRNIKNFEAGIDYESKNFLTAIAKAYISNIEIDFSKIIRDAKPIKLPTYPWQHQTFWKESKSHEESRLKPPSHPFIKSSTELASNPDTVIWELNIDTRTESYLIDHQISGTVVLPGAAQLEIATEIGKQTYGKKFSHLESVTFDRAIFIADDESEAPEIRLEVTSKKEGTYKIFTRQLGQEIWQTNGTGRIVLESADTSKKKVDKIDSLHDLQKRIDGEIDVKSFYNMVNQDQELSFGPNFRLAKNIWKKDNEFLAKIELNKANYHLLDSYNIIPTLLDAALHVVLERVGKETYLPYLVDSFKNTSPATNILWSYIKILEYNDKKLSADFYIFNQDEQEIAQVKNIQLKHIQSQEQLEDLYNGIYEHQWVLHDLDSNSSEEVHEISNQNQENVIIFADSKAQDEIASRLSGKFDQTCYNLIKVSNGKSFKKLDNDFQINYSKKADFEKLFKSLSNSKIHKVINLWPSSFVIDESSNDIAFRNKSQELIEPNLYLLQELANFDEKIDTYFITSAANKVTKEDRQINFLQGIIYGMARVFNNEYPIHRLKIIDLSLDKSDLDINHIHQEVTHTAKSQEFQSEVAYRAGKRYARKLVKSTPNQDDASKEVEFSPHGTYLITGGASGLGLTLAEWMFERGARSFALVSRSGPKFPKDRVRINGLIERGANIKIEEVFADVGKESDLKEVLNYIDSNMPQIKGVVHCAGVLEDGSIPNITIEKFMKVYNPKSMGAWNLHRLTLDYDISLFVTISSASSYLGIAGQVNYASSNNLLNNLSLYRQCNSLVSKSACYGLISGDIANMSDRDVKDLRLVIDKIGAEIIPRKTLESGFEILLNSNSAHLMISPMDWNRYLKSFSDSKNNLLFQGVVSSKNNSCDKSKVIDQILAKGKSDRLEFFFEVLSSSLSDIVGINESAIDINKSINGIGLDSLMLNQFRNWIQSNLEVNYSLINLAKGPSLSELAAELLDMIEKDDLRVDNTAAYGFSDNDEGLEMLSNKWLVRSRSSHKAKVKIFCLHPVGAGASMFSNFVFDPPQMSEIIALQMPGRENRSDEEIYRNMDSLIPDLTQVLIEAIDGDTILWGHSWGGVVLYEISKYVRMNYPDHYRNIKHLIVSGSIAPHLTLDWKGRDSIKETANLDNNFSKVLKTISYIEDKVFLKRIFPVMQKDMEMISTYKYIHSEKLDIGITAFGAIEDEVVLIDEIQQWQDQTKGSFDLYQVHGDHWFLSRNKSFISEKIAKIVSAVASKDGYSKMNGGYDG